MTGIKETIYQFLLDLNFTEIVSSIMVTSLIIVVYIILGFIARILIRHFLNKVLKISSKGPRAFALGKLVSSLSRIFIWFIVIMVILHEVNVDLTPFIASAGVIGIALGFGAQEIVRDFITGFFIILEESFNIGDVVETDGFKGKVLSLGLRTTRIQNWKGEVKILNNGAIKSIINYSRADSLAIVEFGVGYETDLIKMQEVMGVFVEDTFKKYEAIVETPVFSGIIDLANSSINMRLIAKTKTMEHFQIERDIRRDLVLCLRENDIEIPFPQLVIHSDKD